MYQALKKILGDEHTRQLNLYLVLVIGFSVIQGQALMMLVPALDALFRQDFAAMETHILYFAVAVMFGCFFHYQHTMQGFKLALVLLKNLHHRLGDHLMTLPMGWFSMEKIGRLSRSATNGSLSVTNIFVRLLASVVSGILTPLTIAFLMLFIDWRMGATLLLCAPVIYFTHKWCAKWIGEMEKSTDRAGVEASNRVVEFAGNQQVLRIFGLSQEGYQPLESALDSQNAAGGSMLSQTIPRLLVGGGVVQLSFIAHVIVGLTLVLHQELSPAELIALLALSARFTGPLAELAGKSGLLKMAVNDLTRLNEVFDEKPLTEPGKTRDITRPGEVNFEHVEFQYTDTQPVFSDFSLNIPARSMTAIVGSSGSGKTTLMRLIMRYFDVQQGRVMVGGVDVRQQTIQELFSQISLVMQNVYLFDDTLEANVRIGRPDAAPECIEEAMQLAGVNEVIRRLPNGSHTKVGEGGSLLSGGEKQRVAIARAILKNAPVIIFDEATAALDGENERVIQHAMHVLRQRATLIVITHNLSTITLADQIVVLEQGHIVQLGCHTELASRQGRYRDFWQERLKVREWRLATSG
ncbi:ABC transporter ATP-binding protein [Vibrio mangrovi]|uniref:ABC transporter ATP-binding protein n=1 Tax=Vibrio mangrovi TaxID=474394 RepID=A0A1Y6IVB0_9VIBR|nr:ABC transporter ATP-binding protein [Vibrio mangrovi]MDW6002263.1 ABC transporter ATP-binding protein [Vibrio mangrovi]SMS01609.1 Iron import ATP-binding/permease protein IrtB [Vibrio mangrovi]